MMVKLTVLGSGTCVPSLKRNAPGYLLEIKDKKILVDCGGGSLLQLERIKEGLYKEIDYVFITHTHADHITDVNPLIQALKWTPGFERKKDLVLVGPKGFDNFRQGSTLEGDTFQIRIMEIDGELEFDGFKVESAKTIHSDDSIAYKFSAEGKSVVFSGDCDYDEGIIKLSEDADLLIIECSYSDNEKVAGHLTSSECGEIAKRSKVKKLILSHLYPTSPGRKRLEECKKIFSKVSLAHDLMEIEI